MYLFNYKIKDNYCIVFYIFIDNNNNNNNKKSIKLYLKLILLKKNSKNKLDEARNF